MLRAQRYWKRLRVLIALAAIAAAVPLHADEGLGWNPEKTRVFVVGLLEWQHADIWSPFPNCVPNRRDQQLYEFFQDAGVPDEQSCYLQDSAATRLKAIAAFKALLAESQPDELLVFYFAGHGYLNDDADCGYLATYDAGKDEESGWAVPAVFNLIEKHFRGRRALMLADCCHSGFINKEAQSRGESRVSFGCLTSVGWRCTSTGGWTFSDSLLKALRGRPTTDYNDDGYVEFNEVAEYVGRELAFVDGQKSTFAVTGKFNRELKLAEVDGEASPEEDEHCEAYSAGKWYKAEVVEYDEASDMYLVHYNNWSDQYDEWLASDCVRPFQPVKYEVGARVLATDDGQKWYPATVLKSWYGVHLVHYDGWDSSWDQWVGPHAIKPASLAHE